MSAILFLFLSLSSFAQVFQYRAEGSFQTSAGPGTPGTPVTVNYSVSWNETDTTLQGLYRDNYFTQAGPAIASGTVDPNGRTITIILPEPVNGVKSINLSTNQRATVSQTIPMQVITRDSIGVTIDSPPGGFALLTSSQAEITANDPENCDVGFGVLTGYCGRYNGAFNEVTDTANRCDLLTAGNPRLELGTDTVFRLYLNYIEGAPAQSSHTIGALLPNQASTNINITGRYCADLPGTTFIRGNCKTLNLSGDFRRDPGQLPSFAGTYTITDDFNADSCSYYLNVTREVKL